MFSKEQRIGYGQGNVSDDDRVSQQARAMNTRMELRALEAAQQTVSSTQKWNPGTGIIPDQGYICMLYSGQ